MSARELNFGESAFEYKSDLGRSFTFDPQSKERFNRTVSFYNAHSIDPSHIGADISPGASGKEPMISEFPSK